MGSVSPPQPVFHCGVTSGPPHSAWHRHGESHSHPKCQRQVRRPLHDPERHAIATGIRQGAPHCRERLPSLLAAKNYMAHVHRNP